MFRYIVEDNFFEAEDLIKIKSVIDTHEKLRDLNDDNSIIINLNKDFGNYLIHKYENKMINYLNELNPKKNALYDYAEISITISGKNFNYPIHNDSLTKILAIFTLRTKQLDRALIVDRGFIIFLMKKIRSFFIKDI